MEQKDKNLDYSNAWRKQLTTATLTDDALRKHFSDLVKLQQKLKRARLLDANLQVTANNEKSCEITKKINRYNNLIDTVVKGVAFSEQEYFHIQRYLPNHCEKFANKRKRLWMIIGLVIVIITLGELRDTNSVSSDFLSSIVSFTYLTIICYVTFSPLILLETASLKDLRRATGFVYFFDAVYLLTYPVQNIAPVEKVIYSSVPVVLIGLTILTFYREHQIRFGGYRGFAGWVLYFIIIGLYLIFYPKPRELFFSGWLLMMVTVALTSIVPAMVLGSALLIRRIGIGMSIILLSFAWKTKQGLKIIGAISVSLLMLIYFGYTSGLLFNSYVIPLSLFLYSSVALLLLRPPVAVVLTGSYSRDLMELTGQNLFPHRMIALLDQQQLGNIMFFNTQTDNLRILPGFNWQSIVRTLVDFVPLVIVDTRIPGDSLKYETGLMLDSVRVHKAVFVVNNPWGSPALDAHRERVIGKHLVMIRLNQLPTLLKDFSRTGNLQQTQIAHRKKSYHLA